MGLNIALNKHLSVKVEFKHVNGVFNKTTGKFEQSKERRSECRIQMINKKPGAQVEEKSVSATVRPFANDNFDYFVGRHYSFKKAMRKIAKFLSKEERQLIYVAYFRMSPVTKDIADKFSNIKLTMLRNEVLTAA